MIANTLTTSLDGLVALVTGAGGGEQAGIGGAIARCLARAGARVAVNDLTEAAAAATVAQLQAMGAGGAGAVALAGDVTDPEQADGLVQRTVDHFGQIDILVNNAGILGHAALVKDLTDDDWAQVLNVNLHGPFYTSRAAVQAMKPRRFGRIINISSVAGLRVSLRGSAAYTATKEALYGLTRHLAVEVSQHGITANALMPGYTLTPSTVADLDDEALAGFANSIPALRGADPEEVGMMVAFLASPAAGYVTGAAIPMDGAISVVPGGFGMYRVRWEQDRGFPEGGAGKEG